MKSVVFVILGSVLFCTSTSPAQRTTGSSRHDEPAARSTETRQQVPDRPSRAAVTQPVSNPAPSPGAQPVPHCAPSVVYDPQPVALVTVNYPVLFLPSPEQPEIGTETGRQEAILRPDVDGYDFSEGVVVPRDDDDADISVERSDDDLRLVVKDDSDIRDMTRVESPGWAETKSVLLVPGDMYVVRTWNHDFVSVRVTGVSDDGIVFDWMYLDTDSKLVAGLPRDEAAGYSEGMFER